MGLGIQPEMNDFVITILHLFLVNYMFSIIKCKNALMLQLMTRLYDGATYEPQFKDNSTMQRFEGGFIMSGMS